MPIPLEFSHVMFHQGGCTEGEEVAEEPRSLKSQNKNQEARYKKSSSK